MKASADGKKKIVVAGDASIDWLQVAVSSSNRVDAPSWMTCEGTRSLARPGGALLTARFIRHATGMAVGSPRLDELENIPCEKVLHSMAAIEKFDFSAQQKDKGHAPVYRVKQFMGYAGPESGNAAPLPIRDDDPQAGIVVLDDSGNGFRATEAVWPAALKSGDPIVILKVSHRLATGPLWEFLTKRSSEKLVIVISADSLRTYGAQISRRLSWERTAKDFVWQMACNAAIAPLSRCAALVVRFGVEGAILFQRREGFAETRLFYDAEIEEGEFADIHPGGMQGLNAAFVAAITAQIHEAGLAGINSGVRRGLASSRRLWKAGFGRDRITLDYPGPEIFREAEEESRIADIVVPLSTLPGQADPEYWCILNGIKVHGLEDVAQAYVREGKDSHLDRIPKAKFGKLTAVDRTEIESFRSIRNLIREFLDTRSTSHPLCIAVFGRPGAGKSFGVTEVATSVAPKSVETIEFNLSQFQSTNDLTAAFHKIRDIALRGKVPLVFFDEFDSDYQGRLGWLKYFLAPMQDGKFREGETLHPIGKAIFVFAGGIFSTFEKFSGDSCGGGKSAATVEGEDVSSPGDESIRCFREAKGPDFVSRLRGYVNIKGCDQADNADKFSMIRRALLLRSLLERQAGHLKDGAGRIAIDPGVLRAFLKIPEYKHGVRSMTAIIEMSMIAGRKRYDPTALPSPEQLFLHVDADLFFKLVLRDQILGSAREKLARVIHEKYLQNQKKAGNKGKISLVPWDRLDEVFRESNRLQADDIPNKLSAVGCGFVPLKEGKPSAAISFTKKELETMAELEHARWVKEKLLAGFTHGNVRNDARRIHPDLVSWQKLPEKTKKFDRDAVKEIPVLLAKAGFEIYRVK